MNKLIVNALGRERRYALITNNTVEKLVVVQQKHSLIGSVFYGTVTKVLPGMNAVFIDIGEEKNGYLHRDKLPLFLKKKEDKGISSYIHQGEKLLVQVEKDATGNKGPRLTGIIEINGRSVVYMPKGCYTAVSKKIDSGAKWRHFGNQIKQNDEGILFRTSCAERTEEEIMLELEGLREQYKQMEQLAREMKHPGVIFERHSFVEKIIDEMSKLQKGTVIIDSLPIKQEVTSLNENDNIEVTYYNETENIFSAYHLEHEIEKALKRVVWLNNGAYLIFDEAEALTFIDVNTGKFSGKNNLGDTIFQTNKLAVSEIARHLRLRDLAGIIIIDFIDMKDDEERKQIITRMQAELQKDDKRTRIVGFTELGLLQITRKKTRVSISEALTEKCSVCEGTGRVLSAETVAFKLERELWEYKGCAEEAVLIEITNDVKEVFVGREGCHQQRLEKVLGFDIYFSTKEAGKPYYSIRQFGDAEQFKEKL